MPICALCENDVDILKDSHLLPRAVYKHMLKEANQLIRLDSSQNVASYDQNQISEHLLCDNCEDLFSKHGETRMGLLWATKTNGFPLLTKLNACTPLHPGTYDAACLDPKDLDALIYFAVSVFWRANVWPDNRYDYRNSLGPKYSKEFQNFLLGKSALTNFKLILEVNSNPDDKMNNFCSVPVYMKKPQGHVHQFGVLGLNFSMVLGSYDHDINNLFKRLQSPCFIIVDDVVKTSRFNFLSGKAQGAVLRGNLAKRTISTRTS